MKLFLTFVNVIMGSLYLVISPGGWGGESAHAFPQLISLKFPQPEENVGAPRTTAGGGVRSGGGQCLGSAKAASSLQALIPAFIRSPKTTSQQPTLYFSVPDNQGQTGEIVLKNILGETIYKNRFQLTSEAGIFATTLAPNRPLETNGVYNWSLRIICDPAEPSQDIFLKGSFEYVDRPESLPPIPKTLTPEDAQTALDIATQYAEQGLWLDSLNLVSLAYPSAPQEWDELLESVGLNELMGLPLQPCCQGENPSVAP